MKDSKLASAGDKSSVDNSFSRQSIGGGNPTNFRTVNPAAAYADEPPLDLIEEHQLHVDDCLRDFSPSLRAASQLSSTDAGRGSAL